MALSPEPVSMRTIEPYVDPVPLCEPTTTTVKVDPITGQYSWQDAAILVPHEALRVELLRVARVLPHVEKDVEKDAAKRWRVQRLFSYYSDVLMPFLEDHHDTEEKIVGPHYEALGDGSWKVNAHFIQSMWSS